MKFHRKLNRVGQGMTEYIIIVALIALAAIAAFSYFGQTIRGQVGVMSQELAGEKADRSNVTGAASNAAGEGQKAKGLSDYGDTNPTGGGGK